MSKNTASTRMTYGRFLNTRYWSSDQRGSAEGGRTAIVEAVDTELDNRVQRLRVDLPYNAPELISKLRNANVNFDAHPIRNDGAIWGYLKSNFPILLIALVNSMSAQAFELW